MALIKADRVKETTTSTGTGTIALAGAATGYRAFSAVCAVGDTLYYAIAHQTAGEWEVGLATYSAANTLTRTTVHASSNSNAAVIFSAGTKDVFLSVTKAWLDTFITQTSGTTNYVAKATGTGTIGDSQIFDNGTLVGIGTSTNPSGAKLEIQTADGADSIGMSGYKTMKWESNNHLVYGGYSAGQWQVLKFYTNGVERYRVDAVGNIGVGTQSPSGKLHVNNSTGSAWITVQSVSAYAYFINDATDGILASNQGTTGYKFRYNLNAPDNSMYIAQSGSVGINATSPGAQLQVTTAAAATKGLIVKGASAQSAFMFEVQDSNGRASVAATNSFSTTSVDSGGQLFVQVNDAVAANIGAQISLGGNYVGTTSTTFGAISAKKENATSGNYAGYLQLITSTHGVGNTEKVRITSTGDVGIGATSPVAKLQLGTGTDVMANAGGLTVVGGGLVLDGAGTYADRELYFRYTSTVATISADKALRFRTSNGSTPVEAMRIDVVGNVGIGTTSPSDKLHVVGNVRAGNYSGAGGTYLALTGDLPGYGSGSYPTLKSDGNIYFAANGYYAGYIAQSSTGSHALAINASGAVTKVGLDSAGTSYFAGGALAVGSTTAPAGQLYVTPQAAATKGLVVRSASGQSANLQEWQNNSGTALASVTSSGDFNAGNLNVGSVYCSGMYSGSSTYTKSIYPNGTGGFFSREFCLLRTLPDTVGDYVELFEYAHTIGHDFKISIGAVDYPYWDTATYEHAAVWDSSSYAIPPKLRYHRGTSDFVLEKVHGQTGPYTSRFRVKRTGTRTNTGSSTILVIRVEAWLSSNFGQEPITMMSGTGTSSITGYVANSEYCNPSLYPPPPLGWSGDGTSLSLYGANASGTGNGGSILLQAGAYSTSGSNGKVIVRGLASNTANLQEWQNNAGTALTTIDSAGRIGVGTAPQAGYSLYGTGSIYAGGGGVLVAANAGLFYLNGRVGIGTGTATPVFGCEYTNYMRPIILSGYPDGAGYIGTIINTSSTYANATAKLLSVQNNGTEKFAVFSDGSMAGVDARLTGSIQITSNTPAAFTADQNNLVLNASGFQRLSGTAARTITGIAPPSGASHVDGRMMRIYNVGSHNITLKHNSTSSSIANRFCCVQAIDIVLGPRDFAELIYDATDGGLVSGQNNPCWRVA